MKHNYSVKGLKVMQGLDGLIIDCNLYNGKQKIAHCFDDGNGGMLLITFSERKGKEEKDFNKFIKDYPEQKVSNPKNEQWLKDLHPSGFEKLDDESFVNKLIHIELLSRDLKKDLKKAVIFTNGKGELLEIKFKGVRTIKDLHINHVREKGDAVLILNEMAFEKALEIYIKLGQGEL